MKRNSLLSKTSKPKLSVLPGKTAHSGTTSLDLAIELFLTAKEAQRVTKRTLGNYREFIGRFAAWLQEQGVSDAQSITSHHIRLYLAQLTDRKLTA